MDGGFGDDVGVETVAEVDGVDVVALEVRVPSLASTSEILRGGGGVEGSRNVHYGEEHLEEEVDGI